MLTTRTGGWPIGFRKGWSDWQKDAEGCVRWAKDNEMAVIDLGGDAPEVGPKVLDAGLKIGSVDLLQWNGLITSDYDKRMACIEANRNLVSSCSRLGVKAYFAVMLPEDPHKERKENHELMVLGLRALAPVLEEHGGALVIEGWPGPGALCCTPESYRAAFADVPSKAIGVNYDPSHLIRMGINPIRFVEEFKDRVFHVHGKDTEIFNEGFYEFGIEQPAVFGKGHGFGGLFWRYTIPGHGQMRWTRAFEVLASSGYQGAVSIELEDENFNGTEEGEKAGLIAGARFLASC